ncbi:hypothetical protein [Desulfovibrio sp. JC010]|uniref:hypothetical protein n=1 Tax=Desulfovibrio sp. JC010 TaxID=2593641 RepID=UPI0013D7E554|nr:hypothetical protein [Desulfovibrio sp. JC010]NDV28435.1 hypothetical protein [Desulfovibrio sp. JC010]
MQEDSLEEHFDMASGQVSDSVEKKANLELDIEESRLRFRKYIFWFVLLLVFFLYGIFVHLLFHLPVLLPLMKAVPYSVLLVLFSGSIPTVILSILILATFRARNGKFKESNDQDLLDVVSKVASVARLFK